MLTASGADGFGRNEFVRPTSESNMNRRTNPVTKLHRQGGRRTVRRGIGHCSGPVDDDGWF